MDGESQRAPRSVGQRQRPVLALMPQWLAVQDAADDLDVLPRTTERLVEADAVPTLRDLRSGDAQPEAESAARQRIEGRGRHRGQRGRPAGDLEDRRPQIDPLRAGGDVRQHGRGVGAVCLGGPDAGEAELLRLHGQGDVGAVVGPAPIAEVESQTHGPAHRRRLYRCRDRALDSLTLMQQRPLGRTGLHVSRLALGTMTWGRDTDEHEARDQLAAFVEAGGNFLDTADVYGEGASERLIGALLDDVVPRDELVVATKAVATGREARRKDASRRHLLDALDASLGRLGVDHVDLWQLHAWDELTPLEETLAACDEAVRSGRTHYVGISNY